MHPHRSINTSGNELLKNINININVDAWIYILNRIGFPLVGVYFFSMFMYPFIGGNWTHAQSVWHDWQSLNVGVLAFVSSLIAFNISRYNANKQRDREFIAERALLPQALSELSEHLKQCAELLSEVWSIKHDLSAYRSLTVQSKKPELDPALQKVFSNCIRHGEPHVAEHLAKVLMHLQVSESRILGLQKILNTNVALGSNLENIQSYMFGLAQIQALINETFEFARGEGEFSQVNVGIDELTTAYLNLDIRMETIDNLLSYTKKRLARNNA